MKFINSHDPSMPSPTHPSEWLSARCPSQLMDAKGPCERKEGIRKKALDLRLYNGVYIYTYTYTRYIHMCIRYISIYYCIYILCIIEYIYYIIYYSIYIL